MLTELTVELLLVSVPCSLNGRSAHWFSNLSEVPACSTERDTDSGSRATLGTKGHCQLRDATPCECQAGTS